MKIAYIYGLKDPRDGQIYYVGKSNKPRQRLSQHLGREDCNKYKKAWLTDLKRNGLRPNLVILEETKGNWQDAERSWIAKGIDNDWPLTNIDYVKFDSTKRGEHDYAFMKDYFTAINWETFTKLDKVDKDEICSIVACAATSQCEFAARAGNWRNIWYVGRVFFYGYRIANEAIENIHNLSRLKQVVNDDLDRALFNMEIYLSEVREVRLNDRWHW